MSMNSNSQFSLNQLQNFTNQQQQQQQQQQQSLASRLLNNYNTQNSVTTAVAAAAAAAAVNMNAALAMKNVNQTKQQQLNMQQQLGLGQQQQQQQQQQQKANNTNNLFDNFALNQNFTNSNFSAANLGYSLNLQQQQQQQQQQQHQQHQSFNSNMGQKLGAAVANSLASSLVGLTNLNAASSYAGAQSTSTCNLNNTLFVGNLHASLQEIDLIQVFRPFGRIVECCKKWLHFGFVKFTTEEEACHAYVTLNGFRLKGRPMRLEFQNRTKKARIKAILAQAALQAAANSGYPLGGSDLSGALGSLGLNSLNALGNYTNALNNGNANGSGMDDVVMMNGQLMSQQMKSAASIFSHNSISNSHSLTASSSGSSGVGVSDAATYAAFYKNIEPSSPTSTSGGANSSLPNTFFNPDQLIKFAKGSNSNSNSSSSGGANSDTDAQANKEAANSAYSSFSLEIESDFKDFKDLERNLLENVKEEFKSNKSGGSSGASGKKEPKLSNSSEEIILTLTKKALSPTSSNSPHYHDCLSVSSDSGCRSASFLNDEDSAIASLKSIEHFSRHLKLKEQEKQQQQQSNAKSSTLKTESATTTSDLTISEHCEYTCSNSSPVKSSAKNGGNNCMLLDLVEIENDAVAGLAVANNEAEEADDADCDSNCDTSDDASEIPTDSDCLNDLDLMNDEEFPLESGDDCCDSACSNSSNSGSNDGGEVECELNRFNQVIDKEGNMARKKLEYGIYRSINQTLSLFIEPNDILKQMDASEYDEYNLFPNEDMASAALADSYLTSKQHPFYLF